MYIYMCTLCISHAKWVTIISLWFQSEPRPCEVIEGAAIRPHDVIFGGKILHGAVAAVVQR